MRALELVLACAALAGAPATLAAQTGLPHPESTPASFWWADCDGDGLEDAFLITPTAEARLLHNRGDGTLVDVTAEAGLGELVLPALAAWQDYDLDGALDLYVGTLAGPRLYRGLGGGAFEEVTRVAGLDHDGADVHAGWLDYDRDGLPDLHVQTTGESLLYRNLGEGAFTSVELGRSTALVETQPATAAALPKASKDANKTEPSTDSPSTRPQGRKLLTVPAEEPNLVPGDTLDASGLPPGGSWDAQPLPWCARFIRDQATGDCLSASTVPTLGMLCPISTDLFLHSATGYVGLGTTSPAERLEVVGRILANATGPGASVRGAWVDETRGYLGVQGTNNFDGITTADWAGDELAVAGISVGAAASDNVGVIGHSSGAGVRGEYSGNRTVDFAELGRNGVGLRASGSVHAGTFDGDVLIEGADAQLELFDGDGQPAATLAASTNGLANGLNLYRDGALALYTYTGTRGLQTEWRNTTTDRFVTLAGVSGTDHSGFVEVGDETGAFMASLDGDRDGSANGVSEGALVARSRGTGGPGGQLILQNNDGATGVVAYGGASLGGGLLELYNRFGLPTVELDAHYLNFGGGMSLMNNASEDTVRLFGDDGGDSGAIQLLNKRDTNSFIGARMAARDVLGTGGELLVRDGDGTTTFDLDGENGTAASMYMYETDGTTAFSFQGNYLRLHNSSGGTTITYNRSTGTKSGVVDTPSHGERLYYSEEATEVWLTDYGGGQLVDGCARIRLDPIFLESVTISDQHPMRVFVTPTAPCMGVWVEQRAEDFVVHELGDGRNNATFNWRVAAKRKGVESTRLESMAQLLEAQPAEKQVPALLEPLPEASKRLPPHERARSDSVR